MKKIYNKDYKKRKESKLNPKSKSLKLKMLLAFSDIENKNWNNGQVN